MAKKVSKEINENPNYQQKSANGDNLGDVVSDNHANGMMYNPTQIPTVITEGPMEPVTSVTMDTEASAYNQEHEVALSNLNPVPLHLNKSSEKDPVYGQSSEEQSSYVAQNLIYENTDTFPQRALSGHLPQSNAGSTDSYTTMLSSFLNQKNGSQVSPHQSLPSLLSLNMQNYPSHGQPHPMVLHHLLAQMEETGNYPSMSRPTSVPLNDAASFSTQLRSSSGENMTFRNSSSFQGQDQYDQSISHSNDSVGYHHSNTSTQHQSPTTHRSFYGDVRLNNVEGRGSPKQNHSKS